MKKLSQILVESQLQRAVIDIIKLPKGAKADFCDSLDDVRQFIEKDMPPATFEIYRTVLIQKLGEKKWGVASAFDRTEAFITSHHIANT